MLSLILILKSISHRGCKIICLLFCYNHNHLFRHLSLFLYLKIFAICSITLFDWANEITSGIKFPSLSFLSIKSNNVTLRFSVDLLIFSFTNLKAIGCSIAMRYPNNFSEITNDVSSFFYTF